MRRLARHLFTLCSAVSLVLCVAIVVMWVRSAWRCDYISRVEPTASTWFVLGWDSNRSRMGFNWGSVPANPASGSHVTWFCVSKPAIALYVTGWQRYGWEYAATVNGQHVIRYLAVHDGWLAMLTFALPAARFLSWWRRHCRVRANRCAKCGYDLRASPDRCPECGAPAVQGTA
jgi:hypothetical protein